MDVSEVKVEEPKLESILEEVKDVLDMEKVMVEVRKVIEAELRKQAEEFEKKLAARASGWLSSLLSLVCKNVAKVELPVPKTA
jgi:hypothetical protein